MKMMLAEAFMKRNDLKKEIAELTLFATQNLWQDVELKLDFTSGVRMNPAVAYGRAMQAMSELQALNVAIAKANTVNNEMLRELETVSARIALHESIVQMAERYPGDRVRERNYLSDNAAPVILQNEWNIDVQFVRTELLALRQRKRDLEKALAHSNFVTEVIL